jgi:hypothetical protein
MALISRWSRCAICEELLGPSPLWPRAGCSFPSTIGSVDFCDAPLHGRCYEAWPERQRFARPYVASVAHSLSRNANWGVGLLTDRVCLTFGRAARCCPSSGGSSPRMSSRPRSTGTPRTGWLRPNGPRPPGGGASSSTRSEPTTTPAARSSRHAGRKISRARIAGGRSRTSSSSTGRRPRPLTLRLRGRPPLRYSGQSPPVPRQDSWTTGGPPPSGAAAARPWRTESQRLP